MLSMKTLGQKVRTERNIKGITIKDLSKSSGVSASTISRVENGLPVKEAILARVLHASGLSTEDYYFGKDEPVWIKAGEYIPEDHNAPSYWIYSKQNGVSLIPRRTFLHKVATHCPTMCMFQLSDVRLPPPPVGVHMEDNVYTPVITVTSAVPPEHLDAYERMRNDLAGL